MEVMSVQIPIIILPTVAPTGTEVEIVADAVTHVSLEPANNNGLSILEYCYEKTAFIFAQEVVVAGVPGPLNIWVEESAYPSAVSPLFWSAIGGGGGAFAPIAFDTIVGVGVNDAVHGLPIHWNSYAPFIRVVVQTPFPAAAAFWAVQVIFAAQGR